MEDMKNIFKDIFYINEDGDYFPLFKENSQEFLFFNLLFKKIFYYETQKLIIKLLLLISKKGKEVEINRKILAQNPYFDIYQLFCLMDREKKNIYILLI